MISPLLSHDKPDKPMINPSSPGQELSYHQLLQRVAKVAARIRQGGPNFSAKGCSTAVTVFFPKKTDGFC